MGILACAFVMQLRSDMVPNSWTAHLDIGSLVDALNNRNFGTIAEHVQEVTLQARLEKRAAVFAELRTRPYVSRPFFQQFGKELLECNPMDDSLRFKGDGRRPAHRSKAKF
jgi:hypothetical protein